MTIFEANISQFLINFFKKNSYKLESIREANTFLEEVCGVQSFFQNAQEIAALSSQIKEHKPKVEEPHDLLERPTKTINQMTLF